MLTPPTSLSHLLWSLICPLWPQLLMNTMRASPMMRSPCWRESSTSCTSSVRREGDHLRADSSATTPPTSSPTVLRGRNLTPPTSMTTPSRTTTARATTTTSIASGTIRRRNSRRSCPEHVLPSMTLTSPVITPPGQRRMRRSITSKVTSPAFASWVSLRETFPTLTPT
jgi:hypothetical protein